MVVKKHSPSAELTINFSSMRLLVLTRTSSSQSQIFVGYARNQHDIANKTHSVATFAPIQEAPLSAQHTTLISSRQTTAEYQSLIRVKHSSSSVNFATGYSRSLSPARHAESTSARTVSLTNFLRKITARSATR